MEPDDIAARAELVRADGLDEAWVVPSFALGEHPDVVAAYHEGVRELPPPFRAWSWGTPRDGCVGTAIPATATAVPTGLVFVHPGAATGTPHPALTDYVTQMHTAYFTLPRRQGTTIVWAMLAGLAPLHHERAAARGAPAFTGEYFETSSYGPQAIRAMELTGKQLVYGSDRPVLADPRPYPTSFTA